MNDKDYQCKNIADGSVTQTLEVEGWISCGWNLFRQPNEWRAAIRIGDHMKWQWCGTEEAAAAWVKNHLPEDFFPNPATTNNPT